MALADNVKIAIESIHVLSAIVVVGYYSLLPIWKATALRAGDPAALRTFFAGSRQVQTRTVLPALALVFVTGLLMAFLPRPYYLVHFPSSRTWVLGVMAITVVLGVLLHSLNGPAKKMERLVEAGEGTGPAMDTLWGEWRTSLISGAVLSVIVVILMVIQG